MTENDEYKIITDEYKTITDEQLDELSVSTGKPIHFLLKRKIISSHCDFDVILKLYKEKIPFYLYIGHTPLCEKLNLNHYISFKILKYLQEIFNVFVVIQINDDENFLSSDTSLETCQRYAVENIKDIIAMEFQSEKTLIFCNSQYIKRLYPNILKIRKLISLDQVQKIFNFNTENNIGKISFPAIQLASFISSSFFSNSNIQCLTLSDNDQDKLCLLSRNLSTELSYPKPALLYFKFVPALTGSGKISYNDNMSDNQKNIINLSDDQKTIKNKINKYAFSGGAETLELHRKNGGNPDIDISYQYLTFFLDDDELLKRYYDGYKSGIITSGEMKKLCIDVLSNTLMNFQEHRSTITDDFIKSLGAKAPFDLC